MQASGLPCCGIVPAAQVWAFSVAQLSNHRVGRAGGLPAARGLRRHGLLVSSGHVCRDAATGMCVVGCGHVASVRLPACGEPQTAAL